MEFSKKRDKVMISFGINQLRINRLALLLLIVLGCLVGLLGWNCFAPVSVPVKAVSWNATSQWIMPKTPRHRFYLRRTITLPDYAQGGWLRFSADNDFVLYVNGQSIAEEYSYFGRIPRNSLGLGKYFSETTQTFNDSQPYDLRTSDIVQISYTRDWKLTGYFDLTQYLKPGKNVISVEIQASHLHPRFLAEGVIYPTPDRESQIRLDTGTTDWRLSPLPVNRQKIKWFDVDFPDQDWQFPEKIPVHETTYSRLSDPIFDRLLQGQWVTGDLGPQRSAHLQKVWMLPQVPHRAVIRLAGDGQYRVLINDQLVHQTNFDDPHQLHLYEVTSLLHSGVNTVSVRLLSPLVPEWHSEHPGPLAFLFDGWTEDWQGHVQNEIASDSTWQSLSPESNTVGSETQDRNRIEELHRAGIVRSPNPHTFERIYHGDASRWFIGKYLATQAFWITAGGLLTLSIAWSLGAWIQQIDTKQNHRRQRGKDIQNSTQPILLGTTVLTPGLLWLIIIGLLKHRFAEAERGIFFAQANINGLIFLIFLSIISLTFLWVCSPRPIPLIWKISMAFLAGWLGCTGLSIILSSYWPLLAIAFGTAIFFLLNTLCSKFWQPFQRVWLPWLTIKIHIHYWILGAILLLGFCLRSYSIGFNDLEPDENVSYDAVRGILRTGAPIATSQIWYTRGPFFHYPLALWLKIVGLSPENARMWSVLWGVATLIMVFVFTRLISGKIWIALIATFIIAIDPWVLWYSRNVRFYQQTQFLYLLGSWSFYRGFIEEEIYIHAPKRWHQYTFCIAMACILLTQEVTITLLPAFTLGAMYFYRAYQWRSDWRVILSGFMASSLFIFNAIVFSIKCLTPLVGLSSMTTGHLKFQVANITFFGTDFFIGFNRMHCIYTLLFLGGWLYFCKRGEGRKLFLFNTVLLNITFITVLVSLKASRYTYPFYPLFSLLAIYSAFTLADWLGRQLQLWIGDRLPMKNIAILAVGLLLLGNIEPDRILASYSESLTPRHLQVSQYIVDHKKPGDVVISNTPSVHANVLKGADYYVPHRMSFFDAVYLKDGRLIDRWEGRRVLTNTDQLNHVLANANRVWIHVFHQPQLPRDAELAKFYETLQTISEPVLDTYGTSLRIWQKDSGVLRASPNRGRDLGAY